MFTLSRNMVHRNVWRCYNALQKNFKVSLYIMSYDFMFRRLHEVHIFLNFNNISTVLVTNVLRFLCKPVKE